MAVFPFLVGLLCSEQEARKIVYNIYFGTYIGNSSQFGDPGSDVQRNRLTLVMSHCSPGFGRAGIAEGAAFHRRRHFFHLFVSKR